MHYVCKINTRKNYLVARSVLTRMLVMFGWTLLGATSAPVEAQTRADYCSERLPFERAQPVAAPLSPRYVNSSYGYSVALPAEPLPLRRAEGPDRGFFLSLPQTPRGYLRVDAAYDVFYDITADNVHRRDLNAIKLHDTVIREDSAASELAREPALRSLIRLQCRGSSELLIHESIVAVRRREIYRLDLQSTPERLAADERLLEQLWHSWRWEPVR
jgi:hypothetical protein